MARKYLTVSLDEELQKTLKQVTRARKESMSTFCRRSTLKELARMGYLTDKQMQALEI